MKSVRKKNIFTGFEKTIFYLWICFVAMKSVPKKIDILLVFETEGVLSVFLVEHSICAPFVFGKILVLLFLLN